MALVNDEDYDCDTQGDGLHDWERSGYSPDYGTLYVCRRCGAECP